MPQHQVTCVIQQLRGLPADRTAKLLAFADRLEQVSAWVRSLRFPEACQADPAGFSLADSRWLETIPSCRAHGMSFNIEAALPAFSEIIPLEF